MTLIFRLPQVLEMAKKEYEKRKNRPMSEIAPLALVEEIKGPSDNLLVHGDNLDFLEYRLKLGSPKIQLVYMDPPFYSKASYEAVIRLSSDRIGKIDPIKPVAYDDQWYGGMEEYLFMICVRLYFIRDILAEQGCVWVHLDWHVVHYVKVMMDEIFGEENLVNEVIWNYKSGGASKKSFSKKHDTLLFYSKNRKYLFQPLKEKSYNRDFKPYRFKGVTEYQDETGWYTMVNMKDVWQIDMVGRTSAERTGYATQKPEALMRRIIESCSREGDLCADFFGGSGTLATTAQKLGRNWISCDASRIAIAASYSRLARLDSSFVVLGRDKDLDSCSLTVEISENNGRIVVALKQYNLEEIPRLDEGKEVVMQLLEHDSLQLLEYWSVDFDYDGILHRPQVTFFRAASIVKECESKSSGVISIAAVDVLGNRCFRVFGG